MGVRILEGCESGTDDSMAVLFCSTSGMAFGPLFDDHDEAEAFLQWVAESRGCDVRTVDDLAELVNTWRNGRSQ